MLKIKKYIIPIILVAAIFLTTGCQSTNLKDNIASDYSYSFKDSTGNLVTLNEKPKKIAILFSSYVEIWNCAGGKVDVTVGEAVERGFSDNDVILVDSGAGHSDIDKEALISAKPDFVVGTADYESQEDAVTFCNENGIPGALFSVESFQDYLEVLRIFCDINDNTQSYETYGIDVEKRISEILLSVENYLNGHKEEEKRILFIRAGSSSNSTKAKNSSDNFVCNMLNELGSKNIADSDEKLTGSLSLEAILKDNPDYMFISTMGDESAAKAYMNSVLQSDGFKDLVCVEKENYTFLPKDMFHYKPNMRWAEAYEYLAKILYPEIDLD